MGSGISAVGWVVASRKPSTSRPIPWVSFLYPAYLVPERKPYISSNNNSL
jgi:hypothetical protein